MPFKTTEGFYTIVFNLKRTGLIYVYLIWDAPDNFYYAIFIICYNIAFDVLINKVQDLYVLWVTKPSMWDKAN